MRLTRLYTRNGDGGTTRLATGIDVRKDCPRVVAYGEVDELNSHIGSALAVGVVLRLSVELQRLQNELLDLGGDLATPLDAEIDFAVPRIQATQVARLEASIDELNEVTGALENFVLPGGAPGSAALHVARTVCRRAERAVITLAAEADVGEVVIPYLNRLSDLLFAMARYENHERGVAEPLWKPAGV